MAIKGGAEIVPMGDPEHPRSHAKGESVHSTGNCDGATGSTPRNGRHFTRAT